jgi:hypothetical protein
MRRNLAFAVTLSCLLRLAHSDGRLFSVWYAGKLSNVTELEYLQGGQAVVQWRDIQVGNTSWTIQKAEADIDSLLPGAANLVI